MITPLIAGAVQLAQVWITSKARERQSFSDAKVKRVLAAAESEATWTALMAEKYQSGWKDEAWTICFIAIVIACFVPSAQPYIERGFLALDSTPEWFRWAMLASISASCGLRGFTKFLNHKGGQNHASIR